MKLLSSSLLTAMVMVSPTVPASEIYKDDNSENLNLPASWVGGTVPGSSDTAVWDGTVTSANPVNLGGNLNWGGIRVADAGGKVTLGGTQTLTLGAGGIRAASTDESRTVLSPFGGDGQPFTLQPGGHFEVEIPARDAPARRFLRIVGGTVMPSPYQARGHSQFVRFEWQIDDSLDAVNRSEDPLSLYFEGFGEDFERMAWQRVDGQLLPAGPCELRVHVKRAGFAVADPGDFGLTLEFFLTKPGRHRHDVYDPPDQTLFLPIPSGDGGFTEIRQTVTLPAGIASAVIAVGGQRFTGECWVEGVKLLPSGAAPVARPFTRVTERPDTFNYWVGSNLVTRNCPQWKIRSGAETLFDARVFDRCSPVADIYLPLPESPAASNTLRVELGQHAVAASFPYLVRSVELIEAPARAFEVAHSPRFIAQGKPFGVLVETREANTTLSIRATPSVVPEQASVTLAEPGLHVLRFHATQSDPAATATLSGGGHEETIALGQVIENPADPVFLSLGDQQYVDLADPIWPEFFKWYVGQRMGNYFQFRPSYYWSGVRRQNQDRIQRTVRLLENLETPFAWQVEGRTLAGHAINPPAEWLASPVFHGFQAHENDGGYYYWTHFTYQGFFSDMAARMRPYGGIFAKCRPIFTNHGNYVHYDRKAVTDMPDGARRFVENLQYSKGPSTRHTGPSTLFRYFYQAGYDWLGAEQMYGPEETILAALRGASRAYGKNDYGSLHAMQWGSKDYTNPQHAERFFLSLAVAWMHGSSHINSEDALWIDEYGNDRFSTAGKAHINAQQRMLDLIETRQRRGDLHTRVAVIQGRNDAWKCFGRGSLWSQDGSKWAFNRAAESFDLLSLFHPGHVFNNTGPNGWFTATPHGPIDLVPVEIPAAALAHYQVAIFLGWNSYLEDDIDRLAGFVENGGTLILTAAHLNANIQPNQAPAFPANDAAVRRLLGENYRNLTAITEIPRGEGRVIYFPQAVYPADPAIRSAYTAAMASAVTAANASQKTRGWIEPGAYVGFTPWDDGPRRALYLLNINWNSTEPSRPATLVLGDSRFTIPVRRNRIETIHCLEGLAAMAALPTTEVLDFARSPSGWTLRVQTTAADTLTLFHAAGGQTTTRNLPAAGIHSFEIPADFSE